MRKEDGYWKEQDIIHKVKIMMSQHIGAPAVPMVEAGARVKAGDMIAKPGSGLSVAVHASMDGIVREVTDKYIVITER